tara:strand:+ start:61 stop:432 length:372 start_codon:yes stop_codon:yes gene_type:complete
MSTESVPKLENVDEKITDEIIESESESESSESEIMDDEGSFLEEDDDDIDIDVDIDENDLDSHLDDELFQDNNDLFELTELLSSVTTTEEGDTICTALVDISRQLEVQNKIMIKLLSELQKKA